MKNKIFDKRDFRVIAFTCREFTSGRIGREAIALSRFSSLALVPFVAVILFVSHGFRLDQRLSDMLYTSFPSSTKLIQVITGYAENIIEATHNGLFGWISFLCFVWTILWLMINIGIAFNRIWRVPSGRKIWKNTIIYLTVMLTSPFVLMLFLSGWVYYVRFIGLLEGHLGAFNFITTNLFWIAFYFTVVIALSVMYKFIPHIKIKYMPCLKAAVITAVVFVALQYIYTSTQLFVTRLNAVYGILAFIPLFMIWMNLCWQIILFGAELSRGFALKGILNENKEE